jgi:condensin complex subunit 2
MIEERSQKNNLLPDDLHFSSVNFLRLFTKPDWKFGSSNVTRRTLRSSANAAAGRTITFDDVVDGEVAATTQGETGELESNFWAAQASHPEGLANENAASADHNDDPVSFDGEDGGYDYDYDYDGPTYDGGNTQSSQMPTTQMSSFGMDLVQLKNSVSAPRLTFARVAKRVDVQRLKQAIWEEIEEDSPSGKKQKSPVASTGTTFSHLVSGLEASSYPKENLKDVSVSYCFICLLHLANEHGLSINAKDNDLIVLANK